MFLCHFWTSHKQWILWLIKVATPRAAAWFMASVHVHSLHLGSSTQGPSPVGCSALLQELPCPFLQRTEPAGWGHKAQHAGSSWDKPQLHHVPRAPRQVLVQVLRPRLPQPPGEPSSLGWSWSSRPASLPEGLRAAPETLPQSSPRRAGCRRPSAEAGCPVGTAVPFVLIRVDISFHTLLNGPLQKDETEICFRKEKNNVCFSTKQARDLFFL